MPFVIQQLSWYKRRKPGDQPQPVSIEVPDFKPEANHFCAVHVQFDNGDHVSLSGRVTQNPISGAWMVNGINMHGQSVSAMWVDNA
jgi:hypothetical protein